MTWLLKILSRHRLALSTKLNAALPIEAQVPVYCFITTDNIRRCCPMYFRSSCSFHGKKALCSQSWIKPLREDVSSKTHSRMHLLTHSLTHSFKTVDKVDINCTHSWLFRPFTRSQYNFTSHRPNSVEYTPFRGAESGLVSQEFPFYGRGDLRFQCSLQRIPHLTVYSAGQF